MRAQRVAAEFEVSAEGRELRPEAADMAGFAWLSGLLSEGRNGISGTRAQQRSDTDKRSAGEPREGDNPRRLSVANEGNWRPGFRLQNQLLEIRPVTD